MFSNVILFIRLNGRFSVDLAGPRLIQIAAMTISIEISFMKILSAAGIAESYYYFILKNTFSST